MLNMNQGLTVLAFFGGFLLLIFISFIKYQIEIYDLYGTIYRALYNYIFGNNVVVPSDIQDQNPIDNSDYIIIINPYDYPLTLGKQLQISS